MKISFLPLLWILLWSPASFGNSPFQNPLTKVSYFISSFLPGDIFFQRSTSDQSLAIQLATQSAYSHVGIYFLINGKPMILEAVQPVKWTPLKEWVARGKENHFVVKRLKNRTEILNPTTLKKLLEAGESHVGKSYDLYFEWTDEKMYCSELVWKMYQEATGLQIGKLQQLQSFDLSHPLVQMKMKERFGKNIPLKAPMIAPSNIFDATLLKTIFSGKM